MIRKYYQGKNAVGKICCKVNDRPIFKVQLYNLEIHICKRSDLLSVSV